MGRMNETHTALIGACESCIVACEMCVSVMAARESDNDCPACCPETIDVCRLLVGALARGKSPHLDRYAETAEATFEWCRSQCAEHEDEACARCAQACERAVAACRGLDLDDDDDNE